MKKPRCKICHRKYYVDKKSGVCFYCNKLTKVKYGDLKISDETQMQ